MSNTTVLNPETDLNTEIADLFDLDEQQTAAPALSAGYGRSANCTNDGCTRTCVSCGCRAD